MQNSNFNNPFLAEYREKAEIKQTGKRAGLALFANLAIMILWSFVYLRVISYFGINLNTALDILDEPAFSLCMQAFVSVCMLGIPFLIFARCSLVKPSKVISFERPKKKLFWPSVAAGFGFCLLASTVTGIAGQIFEMFGIEAPIVDFDMPDGILGFLLSLLVVAVVPALIEEFIMRGILLGTLKKNGEGFAIIASAYIFGIMHASFNQIPFAILVGLALGVAAVKTGSIWTAVAIHFVNNGTSVVFSYLEKVLPDEWYLLANSVLFIGSIIALVVGIVVLVCRDSEFFKFNTAGEKAKTKKKVLWFIFSPAVILTTVSSLLIATFLR